MKKIILILIQVILFWQVSAQYAKNYDDLYNIEKSDWPYVNDDNVRVRTFPSTIHSKIITKYSKGTKVNVLEKIVNEKDELWYQIRLGENDYGWMFGEYISFTERYSDSNVYKRDFEKYDLIIQFYHELYDIYFDDKNYHVETVVKELINGKSPVEYRTERSHANDGGIFEAKYPVYSVKYGFVETEASNYMHALIFTKDVPNTFGVKKGMTLSQLKEIFGEKTEEGNAPGGTGETVIFNFDSSGKLESIRIYCQDNC